jgi:ubiquinone/menaquinone biosynthesis C-methylase UbiE
MLAILRSMAPTEPGEVLDAMEARKRAESAFHDEERLRAGEGSEAGQDANQANKKYYKTTANSQQYLHDWLQTQASGKIFLDYACGNGQCAILAAKRGAVLAIGIDISPISVGNARRDAERAGVSDSTRFICGDCEKTGLPDECIDVMLCSGMLHHLDLGKAFPEMRRIMKPGGVCLAVEALAYNPLIQLYRRLTPSLRTAWESEHILSFKDLRRAREFFVVRNVRYWHLFSILAAPFHRTCLLRPLVVIGNLLDSAVLRIPPLSYLAWQFTFELYRPK